ncbi:MAG TPA: hypothetical protein VMQ81_06320, partial [Acidimicrobiia bacterium]|nr:hypothetical protein [Acidimicrobiia bacterium]
QELVLITPDGAVVPFLRMDAQHEGSELAGQAFSPDGKFMYFSSQRGGGGPGITYAVTGPFVEKKKDEKKSSIGQAFGALPSARAATMLPPVGAGTALAVGAAGALWRLRDRDAELPST